MRPLDVRRLGVVSYADGLDLQAELVVARRAGDIPDTLLLLEHPHVITLGSGSRQEHILVNAAERAARGIELFETGRGGDVTYHGPGQLVAYPVLDLKPDRQDLHRYLRDLESMLIRVAGAFTIGAVRSEGQTGVWTDVGKLAAIGVRVSSGWITSHGVALNVSTDLDYFQTIVPCGIADREVTSLERELGRSVPMDEASDALVEAFCGVFEREIIVA
ncbi:MAG: lipoyl(octanoyl) transferase LipB [Longimicrobiales bacterium]